MTLDSVVEREALKTGRKIATDARVVDYSAVPFTTSDAKYVRVDVSSASATSAKTYLNPADFDISYLITPAESVHSTTYNPDKMPIRMMPVEQKPIGAPQPFQNRTYAAVPSRGDAYAPRYQSPQQTWTQNEQPWVQTVFASLTRITYTSLRISAQFTRPANWNTGQMGDQYVETTQLFPRPDARTFAMHEQFRRDMMTAPDNQLTDSVQYKQLKNALSYRETPSGQRERRAQLLQLKK